MVWSRHPTTRRLLFFSSPPPPSSLSPSFVCISSYPSTIYWKDFFPQCVTLAPIKRQWAIHVRVCFWTVNSILLLYMSILMPVPHSLDCCTFIVHFEIRKCAFFNFVLFQYCFGYCPWHFNFCKKRLCDRPFKPPFSQLFKKTDNLPAVEFLWSLKEHEPAIMLKILN